MKQANHTDAQLTELWNRRSVLNESEWAELYRIVNAALRKRNYKINSYLKSLANEEEDYINEFFSTKVMANANNSASRREVTAQHLRGFFTNFLYDQLEKEQREPSNPLTQTSIDDDGGGDENNDGYQSNKVLKDRHNEALKDRRKFYFSPDAVEETLIHHGMTRRQVTDAARQFFDGLDEWQQQVISRHLCAEGAYALTLSQIQEQYPQTATYYKVKQLGVLHSLRTIPQDYHKTEIGRWLSKTLNIPLHRDHYQMLSVALKILCLIALQLLDD